MKKTLIAAAVASLMLAGCADSENDRKSVTLDTEDKEVGYSMGMTFASRMINDLPDIESEAFVAGVIDGLEGNDPLMSEEDMQASLQAFQQRMMEQQQQGSQQQGEGEGEGQAQQNQAEADAFLAENAEREEVSVTDSGLQYEVLEEGDGASPGANDTVTVHYTGTLIDGSTFDSSRDRGEPVSFPLQNVIAGWTEALQLMQEGDRFMIYLPPELAYGPGGQGSIGPNSALIFDVELISVD
ncbi:MAG: FKBP-type peptidyl-prolyl cis-trans isomerase [Halomonadaceae bacterium]|nr:MAG: FKBP-type peptidyl-prolyl cis-trans isomerase [Halomonadaceae bacterium]